MEGVLIVSEQGKILSANRAAEALLGYGAGELTNLYFSDFLAGSHPLRRFLAERSRPRDAELVRRNGETVPVSLAASALSGATDERLVSVVSRAELDRLNESLLHAQRLAGIGTLTASVAHELTNPISVITATCANLFDELNDESISRDELLQSIALIAQRAFRCARIIEVLRNYAHNVGQEGNDGATIAITTPAAILQDALTMVEQQFRKQARVTVETEIEPGLTTLICDHHRIAQVLINLLTNARDAMQPAGGVIQVHFWALNPARDAALLAQLPATPSANGASGAADLFAFSVSDSGTGLDPATMDRLFEPFFTTKANGQGTGLGLFIARGIVAQHGGALLAENYPGGGATFTVVLPRKQ